MRVAIALALAACAAPALEPAPTTRVGQIETRPVCDRTQPGVHCLSHVVIENGAVKGFAAPNGFGPADLQSAYHIDPTLGAGLTVAVVDAFGYPKLESDLAMYRETFGLPACTSASGCLRIVNDVGHASPLPPLPPDGQEDWTIETALDVDMVSSGCPMCNILVVQTSAAGEGLYLGQMFAASAGANVISDSWGAPEIGGEDALEGNFEVPGVATFASSGDDGNFDGFALYPSTSVHVIGVGGTHLQADTTDPRGWVETAWQGAGSSCSMSIAKPAFQTVATACSFRAAADVSAVADPASGLAVFDSDNGNPGWEVVGGTSAASPLVASMFAAAGHGDTTPAFAYAHASLFHDVTSGSNGNCGPPLCEAITGWDGPTGVGTPDQALVMAAKGSGAAPTVAITFPADGAIVQPGFTIQATAGDGMTYVAVSIDGQRVITGDTSPFFFSSPMSVALGKHVVEADAFDFDHDESSATIMVDVEPAAPPMDDSGCCSTGSGGGGSAMLTLALGGVLLRRPRRAERALRRGK